MPKTAKKATKKPVKRAKLVKPTLVWKRTRRGRPKTSLEKTKKKRATKSKQELPKEIASLSSIARNDKHNEIQIEQSKFQLGTKQNAGEFQAHNLPFDYGHNRIVLLVVDPKFVFIYWEIQADRMQEANHSLGHNAKLTLRFRNLDTKHWWDVSIYERVGNWYLKLDHPEQNLSVEIGVKNDRGDFYSIASSNIMRLPRSGLARRPGPIKWMLVSPTGEKVITEIEEYTDADFELLKKILGPYFFDLLRKGRFAGIIGSSAENVFTPISGSQPQSN